jgi:TPR repeat protein
MGMAQFNLGVMYYEGESVPQDFVEAYKWADIAAVGGLAEALELKEAAAVQMNQDSLMKAKALAQEFLEKRKGRP